MVHILEFNVDWFGDRVSPPTNLEGSKVAYCGRRMKVSPYGNNRPTTRAPTCIECVAKELRDEQAI